MRAARCQTRRTARAAVPDLVSMLGRKPEALRRLRRGVELDENRRLATYHPGIVTRLEHDDLRGREVEGAAVTVVAPHTPRAEEAHVPVHTKLRADDRLHMGRPAESGRGHGALDLAVGPGDRLNLDSSHLVAPGVLDRAKPRRTHLRGLGRLSRRRLPMLCLRLAADCTLRHSSAPSRSSPAGMCLCGIPRACSE